MNYRTVKHPAKRVTKAYNSSLKIQNYGEDNLYPQMMRDLLANSPTGQVCCNRYRTFIEGNGWTSEDFAYLVINRSGETMDELYRQVARDLAECSGFALHFNYNLQGKISEIRHVPFESVRIDEEDDDGRVPFYTIHPDWEGNKTRRGRTLQVNKKNIKKIYPFAPIREVIFAQMEADGGLNQYRGQLLYVSLAGKNVYPRPVHDAVITELSVDEGLSNVKYRNVRNNFLLSGMIVKKKGAVITLDEEGNDVIQDEDDGFSEGLEEFQGDVNACSLMEVTYNSEEDIPKFINVEGANFDKKFQITETSTVERIYSAYGQEPFYNVRIGNKGFSGEQLPHAYEYYNSYVEPLRRLVSRTFRNIFKYWKDEVKETGDFILEPLVYQYNYVNGNLDNTQKQNGDTGADIDSGGGA